jgi:hypothetical protein
MSKKLPAILIKSDFFLKPRNRKWLAEQGAEALVVLLAFWAASSQEKNCKLKKSEILFVNFPIQVSDERVFEILGSAVAVGLLEEDEENFFNSQIVKDNESFLAKSENYSKGHQKRGRNQDKTTEDSSSIQDKSKINSSQIQDESIINHSVYVYDSDSDSDLAYKKWSGRFARLDEITAEQYATTNSSTIVRRAIEILDGWVLSAETNPQEFQIRKEKAKNAAGQLQSWALSKARVQIADERKFNLQAEGKKSNHQKNMELIAQLRAEEEAGNA